jgi:hypothetical protein
MLGKTGGYWTWLFNIGWRLVVLDLPNTVCEKLSVIYKRCVQRDGYDDIDILLPIMPNHEKYRREINM